MCEEIELHRYDDTPWGFRLTGGHDFGIPLTVVRVSLKFKIELNVKEILIS